MAGLLKDPDGKSVFPNSSDKNNNNMVASSKDRRKDSCPAVNMDEKCVRKILTIYKVMHYDCSCGNIMYTMI